MKPTISVLTICVILCLSVVATNAQVIETRNFQIIKPNHLESKPIYFGASVTVIQSNNEVTLYVGAPKSENGVVFNCSLTSESGESITCTKTISNLGDSGAMGMTVSSNNKDLVMCGNTYTFLCPASAYPQRMIGSCYKYNYAQQSTIKLATPCPQYCDGTDILFVVDSSNSLSDNDFTNAKNWVIDVLKYFRFDVDAGRIKVGFILFATESRVKIPLSLTTFEKIKVKIDQITKIKGSTYIGRALNNAITEMTQNSRKNYPKQIILLTDGKSIDGPRVNAEKARNKGIIITSVGVGSEIDDHELMQIASSPDNVFEVTNYAKLSDVIPNLAMLIIQSASLEDQYQNSTNLLYQCQAGFAMDFNNNNELVTSLVGAYDRTGSTISYTSSLNGLSFTYNNVLSRNQLDELIQPETVNNMKDTYLGYSVTSGNFYGGSTEYIASGSPRYMSKGRVVIYLQQHQAEKTDQNHQIIHPGDDLWQLGGYFGQAVLAVDLNKDSYDDLLVSAPLYNDNIGYDQGRVFVYLNNPDNPANWNPTIYQPQILMGSNTFGSRFGMSITVAGDIDRNGFDDILIGAPNEGQGAVYLYYVTRAGIQSNTYQRILSSQLHSGLQSFGYSSPNKHAIDIDLNGYPDMIVSAPISDKIVVLKSRPVIDITSSIIFINKQEIKIVDCLENKTIPCLSFSTCIKGEVRSNTNLDAYGIKLIIVLDSLVSDHVHKRLWFFKTTSATVETIVTISSKNLCMNHSITLNPQISETSLPLQIDLTYEPTDTQKSIVMSPVLDPVLPNFITSKIPIKSNCKGQHGNCEHNLQISATFSLKPSDSPFVIKTNPETLRVNIKVENKGPDYSYLTEVHVKSGQLLLSKMTGTSVTLSDSSDPGLSIILFDNEIMQPNTQFDFEMEYSLAQLIPSANISEVIIYGHVYSNENITVNLNNKNNFFQYQREIVYAVSLTNGGNSKPDSIFFNHSTTPNFVQSLTDQVLGGNLTNILHKHMVHNNGPNVLAHAPMVFAWPQKTLDNLTLLYLYDLTCEPKEICSCLNENKVNSFQLPLGILNIKTEKNQHNLTFPTSQTKLLPTSITCNDVTCEQIKCTILKLPPFQTVTISASFKLWTPSLNQEKLSTTVPSWLSIDTSKQHIYPNQQMYNSTVNTHIASYIAPIPTQDTSGVNIWAIIGGILGGVVLLAGIIFGLWKKGFFEKTECAKRKDTLQQQVEDENSEEIDTIPEADNRSIAELLDE